jgi:hypothetical protein
VSTRVLLLVSVVLGALAVCARHYERRAAEAFAHHGEDIAQLAALLSARTALETSVLESRSGILLNFDPINRAALSLRFASREAIVVRGRGAAYTEAADALDRLAEDARREESSLETLKTDLALLRLSSRYFPIAAEALSHPDETSSRRLRALSGDMTRYQQAPAPELAWRITADLTALDTALTGVETRVGKVSALRADVERFEEAPTREVAQRLETEIPALDAARSTFEETARADLDVLLGHTRAILERRERVDRVVRTIVRSAVRADAEAARAAYERAARDVFGMSLALRIALAEIAAAALAFLAAACWSATRGTA